MPITDHLETWIQHLTTKQIALGGFSVCPFAKGSAYEVVETDGSNINPPPWDFELIIYVLPEFWSESQLFDLAKEYNNLYTDLIFLPDHKDKNTFINGVQTNNKKYNLLLCQWRDKLEAARSKLKNTDYYSYWDNEYLKEILNT